MNSKKLTERNEILLILSIVIVYRIFYFTLINPFKISYDSDSLSNFIFNSKSFIVFDFYRTPVYPNFLKLLNYIFPDNLLESVVIIQNLLSILSIYWFLKICKALYSNSFFTIISSIGFGIWSKIILPNNNINPESFSIIGSVFLIYQISKVLKKSNSINNLLIGLILLFLILLKPVFIVFLPIFILLFLFDFMKQKESRAFNIYAYIGLGFCITSIWLYGNFIKNKYGVFTISGISINNSIGVAINSGVYKYSKDKEIVEAIDSLKGDYVYQKIFYLNNHTTDNLKELYTFFPKKYKLTLDMDYCLNFIDVENIPFERLQRFTNESYSKIEFFTYLAKKTGSFVLFYWRYSLLLFLSFILLIFKKYSNPKFYIFSLLSMLIASNYFVLIIAGIDDFSRLFNPTYPFLVLICFAILEELFFFLKSKTQV